MSEVAEVFWLIVQDISDSIDWVEDAALVLIKKAGL